MTDVMIWNVVITREGRFLIQHISNTEVVQSKDKPVNDILKQQAINNRFMSIKKKK